MPICPAVLHAPGKHSSPPPVSSAGGGGGGVGVTSTGAGPGAPTSDAGTGATGSGTGATGSGAASSAGSGEPLIMKKTVPTRRAPKTATISSFPMAPPAPPPDGGGAPPPMTAAPSPPPGAGFSASYISGRPVPAIRSPGSMSSSVPGCVGLSNVSSTWGASAGGGAAPPPPALGSPPLPPPAAAAARRLRRKSTGLSGSAMAAAAPGQSRSRATLGSLGFRPCRVFPGVVRCGAHCLPLGLLLSATAGPQLPSQARVSQRVLFARRGAHRAPPSQKRQLR